MLIAKLRELCRIIKRWNDESTKREHGNKNCWLDEMGKFHRDDDLPADIWSCGCRTWYMHGERHRENGPAVIKCHRSEQWWYHGKYVDCKTQEEFERLIKLELFW